MKIVNDLTAGRPKFKTASYFNLLLVNIVPSVIPGIRADASLKGVIICKSGLNVQRLNVLDCVVVVLQGG